MLLCYIFGVGKSATETANDKIEVITLTTDAKSPMNQSEFKASALNWRQARENASEQRWEGGASFGKITEHSN